MSEYLKKEEGKQCVWRYGTPEEAYVGSKLGSSAKEENRKMGVAREGKVYICGQGRGGGV